MKITKHMLVGLLGLALVGPQSWADSVTTVDGVTIPGRIVSINEKELVLETDFSAAITFQRDKVQSFKTDEVVTVKLQDGQKLAGKIQLEDEQLKVTSQQTEAVVNNAQVTSFWGPGVEAVEAQPDAPKWKFKLGAEYTNKNGNTDERRTGINFEAALKTEVDQLKFYARYFHKETNGNEEDDERIVGVDYYHYLTKRLTWYVRGELEDDEYEGIDLRATAATGVGYDVIQRENLKLVTRAGAFTRTQSYTDNTEDDHTYGVDLGLRLDYTHDEMLEWYTDITYTPSIEKISNYIFNHESAMSMPLGGTDWRLKLGVLHEYNSQVGEDKERLDTTLFSRIELNF